MFARMTLSVVLAFFAAAAFADQHDRAQQAVVMDEDRWVTFYDLPSRRFRAIRTAVLNRETETAARDLQVTANYIAVEADRASAILQPPLREVVETLGRMSREIDSTTLADLGSTFGRAHWLLAQHYLEFARSARDARQDRNASLYLWATTHHMERAILWSNGAITREVRTTLDSLRNLAGRLQSPDTAARAYRDKPVVRAGRLLAKIGQQIDRPVLVPVPPPADSAAGADRPEG